MPGGYILVANHASLLDGVILQSVMRRRVRYLLTILFYRKKVLAWFFRWVGVIPIYEGGGNKTAMAAAVEALRAGNVVGIFPEGGLSSDGTLQKAQPGVAMIAEGSQVPVVPAAICGSFGAMSRHSFFPKPVKIEIRFGDPIPPPQPSELPRKERYREFTDRVMSSIEKLMV